MKKSTVEEIRRRFDADVERFANLETGQSATVDVPLAMELIVRAAAAVTPAAWHVLDIGCGAGNYTLKLLNACPSSTSRWWTSAAPCWTRPAADLRSHNRERHLHPGRYPQAAVGRRPVRHYPGRGRVSPPAHRRRMARRLRQMLRRARPGGSLWISDLIEHTNPAVQALMWQRYGAYLAGLKDEAYRDHVFAYIAKEDTRGRCCTRSTCCAASGSAQSKSCTKMAASPPSARSSS